MRRAPVLATLALLGGGALVLLGGRLIASDEPVLIDVEAMPAQAEPSPAPAVTPRAPDLAHTAEVPVRSRMVAPKVVAPPQVAVADLERAEPREPLSQLSLALPPPPKPSSKWSGTPLFRPVATQSAVFESMGRTVTLAGTDSIPPDETCLSRGVAWPCGVKARAAFRLWLRGRALVCKLPPEDDSAAVVAACRLGKQDVGGWLVANGWARATPGGPYVQEGEKAESEGLGIFGEAPDTSGIKPVPAPPAPSFSDQPILLDE